MIGEKVVETKKFTLL